MPPAASLVPTDRRDLLQELESRQDVVLAELEALATQIERVIAEFTVRPEPAVAA